MERNMLQEGSVKFKDQTKWGIQEANCNWG